MNQRTLRQLIIGMLAALNLVLAVFLIRSYTKTDSASATHLDEVLLLYERAGLSFEETPVPSYKTWTELQLGTADLDQMVENYLDSQMITSYRKSYIYGAKAQYQTDSLTFLTNRPQHTITYTNDAAAPWKMPQGLTEDELMSMIQPLARRFAESWLGDVFLSEWRKDENGYRFVYRQMKEDQIYFFNTISLLVTMEGVRTAVVTVWDINGSAGSIQAIPQDEMLYAGLIQIGNAGEAPGHVERISDGYVIASTSAHEGEQTARAVPVQTIYLSSGRSFTTRYCGN
ncbi:MAG: hypothetical protein J6P72_11330 [Firmicutes bacterium]|nr:hypothetical protein [Bacillota bacterium]